MNDGWTDFIGMGWARFSIFWLEQASFISILCLVLG